MQFQWRRSSLKAESGGKIILLWCRLFVETTIHGHGGDNCFYYPALWRVLIGSDRLLPQLPTRLIFHGQANHILIHQFPCPSDTQSLRIRDARSLALLGFAGGPANLQLRRSFPGQVTACHRRQPRRFADDLISMPGDAKGEKSSVCFKG